MDSRKCQTVTATPAKPGELPVGLGSCCPFAALWPLARGSRGEVSYRAHWIRCADPLCEDRNPSLIRGESVVTDAVLRPVKKRVALESNGVQ
jgi:hypothetical protein